MPNFILMRFEITEPIGFLKNVPQQQQEEEQDVMVSVQKWPKKFRCRKKMQRRLDPV